MKIKNRTFRNIERNIIYTIGESYKSLISFEVLGLDGIQIGGNVGQCMSYDALVQIVTGDGWEVLTHSWVSTSEES